MTLTVAQAFAGMKSNLEITDADQQLAVRRRADIHERLMKDLDVATDLVLSGSFHRHTKTRPLKDVDFLCPMLDTPTNRRKYRDAEPHVVLDAFVASLKKRYGDRVGDEGRRSVRVDFGSEDKLILSYDIVPAFERADGAYDIPDKALGRWIASDPRVHAKLATAKNQACDDRWKPLIKMLKGWNRQVERSDGAKAIKPSFLIEVMCLELVDAPLSGDWATDLQFAFANLALHVDRDWPDPSGLGPNVNEMDATARARAKTWLTAALRVAEDARHLAKKSDRQAILRWKELFGPLMPIEESA